MNNIEILEEKIKIIESLCTDDCINKSTVIQPLKYAIENLIKENKELKNKCNELNFKYTAQWVDDNFIPKSKVKEKIEVIQKRMKEELKGTKGQDRYAIKQEYMYKRNILQSLLEKE